MTSTQYTSNHRSQPQPIFKEQANIFEPKQESKFPSCASCYYMPQNLNNSIFNSNISMQKFPYQERSQVSLKSEPDNDFFGKPFIPMQMRHRRHSFYDFGIGDQPGDQSRYQSKISNFPGCGFKLKFETKNLMLNLVEQDRELEKEDGKKQASDEKKNQEKNDFNSFKNYELKSINNILDNCKGERNVNLNLGFNASSNNNIGTKFFTNHNYGYKCSCSKTQCNRKYCECYNSGNYCIDCNCKNCKNQPPINTYSNKRPSDIVSKMKKSKEICTCTKSGCNKNYCECFKSGNKCTALCRCIACENTEDNTKLKNKYIFYECCRANSIYIIKNIIVIEDVNIINIDEEREMFRYNLYENKNNKMVTKKRKREENKNMENGDIGVNQSKKENRNKDESENLFNDSLIDENGRVILRHINMIRY